ncbi:peptidoglycan/LPS O-acetylase OafA/YrhL [Pontibacter aydingkolensis]|uniref:Acyltransferase n=1 Tax=Pontibacter aydingkolensis TaxID=1911536 RepID=A0ABS7CXP4_9BACT|nr:acyltransferase [Pontibacter aydingkolensis]MBW7468611.1 acyltransferase [Pontibacter aydingkolensis]
MKSTHTEPGYMLQLDGLRAIAVIVVVLFHWTPEVKQTGLGGLGVQLFFILSGYLITGILLQARAKAEGLGLGKAQIIKSFYARRFLRIFPLYYIVIVLAALLGSVNVQRYLGWHLGYLTNFAIFKEGHWIGEASHLWSLAVEEQFYLLWPLVILYTPRRYLSITIAGFILLAPFFKLTCLLLNVEESRLGVLPISSFHYLGAGSLLALYGKAIASKENKLWQDRLSLAVKALGVAGLAGFVVLHFSTSKFINGLGWMVVKEFAVISLFVSITLGAAHGFKGKAGSLLSSRPMVYVGQISYGLYLFHNFVPYFTKKLLQRFEINELDPVLSLSINTIALLAISAASLHFLESRLNRYKKHFPYVTAPHKSINRIVVK